MKTIGRLLGAVVVVLLLLIGYARVFGFDPGPWRPGLWLTGEVAETPTDWSFIKEIGGPTAIETKERFFPGLVYSLTSSRFVHNGHLYLGSGYATGVKMPGGRHWNQNIIADPRVRVRIDGKLYDGKLVYVDDKDEHFGVIKEYERQFGIFWAPGYYIHLWRMEPLA
ncbi:MAG: hypothetical protein FJW23_11730 [Acidimicrobiia bacterium]|nr:hypothetical protein [Acidimicrobiia bacterium]